MKLFILQIIQYQSCFEFPALDSITFYKHMSETCWCKKQRRIHSEQTQTSQIMRINYRLVYTIHLTNVYSTLGYRNCLNHQHRNTRCLFYSVPQFSFCVGKELQHDFDHTESKASWFGLMIWRVFNLILDIKNFEV